ncbi:hypothetical protein [Nocardioides pinisoli]|uniref:AAA family ATPase n=1 Tax=Nocardioides pinisoli TaxID=2950279 RepID=A0ABT1KZ01_9ACTN|nr:hypothetical protein [Nocardioides pinisoli]MCP3422977.1 hypothetical protein [Nocardioides pinisoli]
MSERTHWSKPINLDAALAGAPPPEPAVGTWTDTSGDKSRTRALFYPNEVHSVGGEPESMKSWLLLLASVQEIKLGRHVMYVDMEANDRSIVYRLKLLGATNARIKKHFHYFRPDDAISEEDQRRFRLMVKRWSPSLVVLDGVTEAYSLHGLSINSSEDAAAWFALFARRFQTKGAVDGYDGPAIVELDHVVKDRDGRGNWTIGTQHKKAGIKGAMYMVESLRPFGAGKHGVSRLLLAKDSPGGVAYVSIGGKARQRYVADLHCDATGGGAGVDAWIETTEVNEAVDPEADKPLAEQYGFRMLMQDVCDFIGKNPGASLRLVRSGVKGTNERIALAVEHLCRDGFVANEGSGNRAQYVVKQEFSALRVVPGGAD